MKRILALILCLALTVGICSTLFSCKTDDTGNGQGDTTPTPTPDPKPEEQGPTVIMPEFKDYGRNTVNFDTITYERPDIAATINAFDKVTDAIKANELTPEEQIALIKQLDEPYIRLYTMYTLAEINNSRDSSNEFWIDEYAYISTNVSDFSKAIEDLYVAAAQSPNKDAFEDGYFGFSLDEYVDGGIYTDELVALLAEEAALIAEYNSFSTSTVEIALPDGTKGTVDELMKDVPKNKYQSTLTLYMTYYSNVVTQLSRDLYIELIKVRILIAEEMGEESYLNVAYADRGHEYDPEATMKFLADIKDTIPLASDLYNNNFYHLSYELEPTANPINVINELYALYKDTDPEMAEIYAYMLQHGLYDVAPRSDNRLDASYTTYIYGNNSPFIFMTASEKYSDYITLSHEFGHFADMYMNNGNSASIDLSEVYSTAYSYLTLLKLYDVMATTSAGQKAYKYMLHNEMAMLSDILMYQGYLAAFEHLVYNLDYEDVSEEGVKALMKDAQLYVWGYEIRELQAWDAVLMVHTIEYPCYVQSYCTSLVAAVEIMLMEINAEGAGLTAYKTLIDRNGYEELTFEEQLERAGISSPLSDGALLDMFKGVYRYISGRDYQNHSNKLPNVA